ncbi:MAG: reverse transcriptase, partial [bacterium]
QVFPVTSRGIDYVGYKFYHTHTLIRKSIKKSFARKIASNPNHASKASYLGWFKHCNGKHLTKTILKDEKL